MSKYLYDSGNGCKRGKYYDILRNNSDGDFMVLKESGEDYLEAVLILERQNGIVRTMDVAAFLKVSKPSVSRAMGVLKNSGYIDQETYGNIMLTDKGRKKAQEVLDRHKALSSFFEKVLCVSADTAQKDACRAEHVLSQETMDKISEYMKKLQID